MNTSAEDFLKIVGSKKGLEIRDYVGDDNYEMYIKSDFPMLVKFLKSLKNMDFSSKMSWKEIMKLPEDQRKPFLSYFGDDKGFVRMNFRYVLDDRPIALIGAKNRTGHLESYIMREENLEFYEGEFIKKLNSSVIFHSGEIDAGFTDLADQLDYFSKAIIDIGGKIIAQGFPGCLINEYKYNKTRDGPGSVIYFNM